MRTTINPWIHWTFYKFSEHVKYRGDDIHMQRGSNASVKKENKTPSLLDHDIQCHLLIILTYRAGTQPVLNLLIVYLFMLLFLSSQSLAKGFHEKNQRDHIVNAWNSTFLSILKPCQCFFYHITKFNTLSLNNFKQITV